MEWHEVTVVPSLPEQLAPLGRLARNLWFTWHPEVIELWRRLDRDLWEEVYHNPVRMLGRVSQERLEEACLNESFLLQMDRVEDAFSQYMEARTPYSFHLDKNLDPTFRVAYFSMEYGLTEALPIYSGGLGILSGDHLKSASNLNLPIVGIGLLYREGYFGQYLNKEGWQQEYYVGNDYENMPIVQERDGDGKPVEFVQEIGGREVRVNVWRVQVGRVPLYLLNTNLRENRTEDREITAQLYGGDREMRIRQEILLGMGGVRLLGVLGVEPTVYHMNEGHSAFASLERIRRFVKDRGLSREAAFEVVKASTVFTTHTPVPAGNDYFAPGLMERYFRPFADQLGMPFHEFLGLGRQNPQSGQEDFCMTVLAIRLSDRRNGVSRLHQEVSRDMWRGLWPGFPLRDLPIGYVTNGVHIPSYISAEMGDLFTRYLGPSWIEDPDNQKVWERVERIPDTELWRTHERRRERLVNFARNRLRQCLLRRGAPPVEVQRAEEVLDPRALTIGFARRFATYKRATLLLRDPERLARILTNEDCPVQIIFAGKAHPHDNPGKELIKHIIHFARDPRFRDRVVFLEDYDAAVARYLTQGCDIWLNTPCRPREASGTSGMKAAENGVLNCSILDGWWDEGYSPEVGFAIGKGEEYADQHLQDEVESKALYNLIENEIVPMFYDRGRDGLPRDWVTKMKASMKILGRYFNTSRMVAEYTDKYYAKAMEKYRDLGADRAAKAQALATWRARVQGAWNELAVESVEPNQATDLAMVVGTCLEVKARIRTGSLAPNDLLVELYHGPMGSQGAIEKGAHITMTAGEMRDGAVTYAGCIPCNHSGRYGFTVRVLPHHPDLVHPYDGKCILWG